MLYTTRARERRIGMKSTRNATISLGKPITAPALVPVKHAATPACINHPFQVKGDYCGVTALSFGTPHGAVSVADVDNTDVLDLGLALGTHPLFPKGASIVFFQVLDSENLKARLWQRGKGEVPFTPEAACVAATVAMKLQKTFACKVNVSMGGNVFCVQWDRGVGEVSISGSLSLLGQHSA